MCLNLGLDLALGLYLELGLKFGLGLCLCLSLRLGFGLVVGILFGLTNDENDSKNQ